MRERWKMSELGEAAYLAYCRHKAHRARKKAVAGGYTPRPPEDPDWDDLGSNERSAWAHAAAHVIGLVRPIHEDLATLPTRTDGPR